MSGEWWIRRADGRPLDEEWDFSSIPAGEGSEPDWSEVAAGEFGRTVGLVAERMQVVERRWLWVPDTEVES